MPSRAFRAETPLQALPLGRAPRLARQLGRTAAEAPGGQALARVEAAAAPAGRALTRQAVGAARRAQAEQAERKGRPAGAAPAAARAAGPRGTPAATP